MKFYSIFNSAFANLNSVFVLFLFQSTQSNTIVYCKTPNIFKCNSINAHYVTTNNSEGSLKIHLFQRSTLFCNVFEYSACKNKQQRICRT